jgi:hypothetical protein
MCIGQYRDYVKASEFRHADRERDLQNEDVQVKKGTYRYKCESYYYATDLKKIRKLAKEGNQYAIKHLKNFKLEK